MTRDNKHSNLALQTKWSVVNEVIQIARIRLDKEERKKQIKEAALQLFIEKGLVRTTMEDIVKRAKLSKGGMYYHYRNKEEIFEELIKDAFSYRKDLVVQYIDKNPSMSREDLIMNMLLDKILDKNPYKIIYAIFLTEVRTSKELKALYDKIYQETKEGFIQFCRSQNLPEYIPLTSEACIFFINSLILGENMIGNQDEAELREMLRLMLTSYLKHKQIF